MRESEEYQKGGPTVDKVWSVPGTSTKQTMEPGQARGADWAVLETLGFWCGAGIARFGCPIERGTVATPRRSQVRVGEQTGGLGPASLAISWTGLRWPKINEGLLNSSH